MIQVLWKRTRRWESAVKSVATPDVYCELAREVGDVIEQRDAILLAASSGRRYSADILAFTGTQEPSRAAAVRDALPLCGSVEDGGRRMCGSPLAVGRW